MRRGDVFLVALDPVHGSEQAGVRPAVIVSRNLINETRRVVIAVPFTTDRGRRLLPSQCLVQPPDGGLSVPSVALCEQVRAVSKERLIRQLGTLSPSALLRIESALRIALDLDD